ncbi:type I-E CRISPR-associated protein Cas6/Cse3/CasE [Lacticaseibacillus kribbianus]|uniref:type I-E CRISPR-associated protein Cas6/Cse3/CasE n=1 Tax=Lacticaseibacillus kribbianus TaxID=2926292 RepID=UPI001CD54EFA|nr:type I-E CRISPR-associated protein Cas6/Cse3/CasE [Lacticaseibacillus kribbianus]
MFLSRVEIDWRDRRRLQPLTHLGAFHDWVEQSFPSAVATGARPRHLWRRDVLGGREYLLVLSDVRPDESALERYGVPGSVQVKSYDRFLAALTLGQRLRFRLTANPTHAVKESGDLKARGKVYAHIGLPNQLQWLLDVADRAGFAPVAGATGPAFDIVNRDRPLLRHKGAREVRLQQVTYEGLLEITDLERFRETLTGGLGREKAYGMGLMTVIPEDAE